MGGVRGQARPGACRQPLRWDGAVLDGNCDLKSGGGMGIGGGTKALKGLWRVINYGEAQWTAGDIVSDKGSAFVNRGTLESSGAASGTAPRAHTVRARVGMI